MSRRTDSSRGVSDVVAFVLTFSIIITGVGVVSTGGFDQLTEFTADQQVDNGERGMEAAAVAVDDVHRSNDTYREFDLSLSGGNIWFNETALTLKTPTGDPNLTELGGTSNKARIELNALEHRFDLSDETVNIAYEGGGVFRSDTARARYEPGIKVDGDTAIVSLVNLTTDESIDRSGAYRPDITLDPTSVPQRSPVSTDRQFVSFSAKWQDQKRVYETSADDLEIDVSDTAYPRQWGYFFEEIESGSWDNTNNVYSFGPDVETVVIRVSTIELAILPRRTL
ncbi:DUF7289 family protein [Halovenus halobia]|uniref:DUF7289 family protein n=1 Tax=Halovenus halobia TaxID=3396622 RepID=UPI003F57B310